MNASHTSLPSCIAFALTLLAVPLCQDVTAQDRRAEYTLRVFQEDGQCRYEIVDYPDQDTFIIEPAGKIRIHAEGTDARVAVQDDSDRPGVSGDRTLKLKDAGGNANRRKTLNVRGRIGRNTSHTIQLWCCDKRLIGGSCDANDNDATPAGPIRSQNSGSLLWDVLPEPHGRGPAAPPLDPPAPSPNEPLGPGGPTMEVDEDG